MVFEQVEDRALRVADHCKGSYALDVRRFLQDRAAQDPTRVQAMQLELDEWMGQLGLPALDAPVDAPKGMPENLKPEEIEALRALGYME